MNPEYKCAFCGAGVPFNETARTLTTPPDQEPLPQGSGWTVCGPFCPKLPKEAEVFYRSAGVAWKR